MCGIIALLFLIVPATEIYLILKVGGLLGALPTLAMVAFTAIVGATLVKRQGTAVLQKLQSALAEGRGAAQIIAESVLILVAGVTLLAPGFITDALGIALLLPPIRSRVAQMMLSKMKTVPMHVASVNVGDDDPPAPGVIDV